MEDQLILFETAKLAKEKGFDAKCETWKELNENCMSMNYNDKNCVKIPTQSLLQKWLREKYNIIILVKRTPEYPNYYYCDIYDKNTNIIFRNTGNGRELIYESALEQGLQKALKLITKQ